MNNINIKYMSDEAIETLRANIESTTKKLVNNSNDSSWVEKEISEKAYIVKKYMIEDFELQVPVDNKDRNTDIVNSIILYEHLKDLPMYVLTDERFWAWINFKKGYEVALINMPINEGGAVFKDHWLFTQGKRRGLFFGVLSRCYFRVALTVDESLEDPYELTKFIIEKPERFRNLSWRTFSGEKKIVIGTLKAEKRVVQEYGDIEKSEYYTEIAKYISQLGSVMLIDAMSEGDISDYIYNKFIEMVKNDMNNKQN